MQFKSDGHNGETLDGPLVYGSSTSVNAMLDFNILHSTLEKHPSLTGLMQVSIVQPGKLKPEANWKSVCQLLKDTGRRPSSSHWPNTRNQSATPVG